MFQKLSFLFFVVGSTDFENILCISIGENSPQIPVVASHHQKWDYPSAQYGVNAWPKNFPACNGTSQSPIDINNPTYSNLGNIQFTNYGAIPSNVQINATNNGHSYIVSFSGFTDSSSPKIANGGLPGTFQLAGVHFHWGNDHSLGSEHHVDNVSYPAELHLVHLNTKYPNVSVGFDNADGLAVLSVLIQRGQHNNYYSFLNLTEHNVTYPGMTSNFNLSSLMGLLPNDKSFYRYNGSLTTPGCQQVVTWTVFSNAVEISDAQFNQLRDMKYRDINNATQPLVNNHRPLQPLNDRMLLANFGPSSTTARPPSTPTDAKTSTTDAKTSTTDGEKTSTTDGASRISENRFMFFASLFLVLLSFLEI